MIRYAQVWAQVFGILSETPEPLPLNRLHILIILLPLCLRESLLENFRLCNITHPLFGCTMRGGVCIYKPFLFSRSNSVCKRRMVHDSCPPTWETDTYFFFLLTIMSIVCMSLFSLACRSVSVTDLNVEKGRRMESSKWYTDRTLPKKIGHVGIWRIDSSKTRQNSHYCYSYHTHTTNELFYREQT